MLARELEEDFPLAERFFPSPHPPVPEALLLRRRRNLPQPEKSPSREKEKPTWPVLRYRSSGSKRFANHGWAPRRVQSSPHRSDGCRVTKDAGDRSGIRPSHRSFRTRRDCPNRHPGEGREPSPQSPSGIQMVTKPRPSAGQICQIRGVGIQIRPPFSASPTDFAKPDCLTPMPLSTFSAERKPGLSPEIKPQPSRFSLSQRPFAPQGPSMTTRSGCDWRICAVSCANDLKGGDPTSANLPRPQDSPGWRERVRERQEPWVKVRPLVRGLRGRNMAQEPQNSGCAGLSRKSSSLARCAVRSEGALALHYQPCWPQPTRSQGHPWDRRAPARLCASAPGAELELGGPRPKGFCAQRCPIDKDAAK